MPRSERERATVVEVEPRPEEGLPDLVGRLGDDIVQLVESKLGLIKLELDEAALEYAAGAVELAIAAIVALVGFALSATALAFAVGYLLPEGWLDPPLDRAVAFGAVGGLALIVGVAFTIKGRARFSSSEPRSDLRHDRRSDGSRRAQTH